MLRYKTEIAWFSHLVRHLARKQSGSILTTPDPAWGVCIVQMFYNVSNVNPCPLFL